VRPFVGKSTAVTPFSFAATRSTPIGVFRVVLGIVLSPGPDEPSTPWCPHRGVPAPALPRPARL